MHLLAGGLFLFAAAAAVSGTPENAAATAPLAEQDGVVPQEQQFYRSQGGAAAVEPDLGTLGGQGFVSHLDCGHEGVPGGDGNDIPPPQSPSGQPPSPPPVDEPAPNNLPPTPTPPYPIRYPSQTAALGTGALVSTGTGIFPLATGRARPSYLLVSEAAPAAGRSKEEYSPGDVNQEALADINPDSPALTLCKTWSTRVMETRDHWW
ncbi:hypothetical protein VTJ49DRAFT_6205 [Mycothermus thermophilus]|uniref:Uncharacterized protein n=1 Tax=Humicola insolens TaxID=85995 RepID=A0ABR3V1Q3_HUMIN